MLRLDRAVANMVSTVLTRGTHRRCHRGPRRTGPDRRSAPSGGRPPRQRAGDGNSVLAAVVAAASRIPADLIGRPDLGRLAPGGPADLVWLDDDLRTAATWIEGEKVYP